MNNRSGPSSSLMGHIPLAWQRLMVIVVVCAALAAVALAASTPSNAVTPTADVYYVKANAAGVKQGTSFPAGIQTQKVTGPPGEYNVTFPAGTPINACAYVGNVNNDVGATVSAQQSGPATRIRVHTYNQTGADADEPFHLIVAC
jgi:hypothetical protein